MKCLALNVDFSGVRFDPLGSRSPPYERIKFRLPLESMRFLLLSTNLADLVVHHFLLERGVFVCQPVTCIVHVMCGVTVASNCLRWLKYVTFSLILWLPFIFFVCTVFTREDVRRSMKLANFCGRGFVAWGKSADKIVEP